MINEYNFTNSKIKYVVGFYIKLLLLLLILCSVSNVILAQEKTYSAPEHINVDENTLYIGKPTLVVIDPRGDSTHKLSVTVSEGEVVPFDSAAGMYHITVYKPGKTVITVFVETGGIKTLLYSKTVDNKIFPLTDEQKRIAKLKIKPVLSLAGFKKGKLPFASLKKITRFEINSPYKIQSMVIYFSGPYNTDALSHLLISGEFDEFMRQIWRRITVGSIISIDNIKISDRSGKTYEIEGVSFVVTEK